MNIRVQLLIGTAFLAIGLALGAPYLEQSVNGAIQPVGQAAPVQAVRQSAPDRPVLSGEPARIAFTNPAVGIDVAVTPGYYDAASRTWTLSKDKAQFAASTSRPNDKTGNTFIYGHNRPEVFSRLLKARFGDTAIVTTTNNHRFTYRLVGIRDVKPDDTSVLAPTSAPTLTVQTCSGIWYENRRIYSFQLIEAA